MGGVSLILDRKETPLPPTFEDFQLATVTIDLAAFLPLLLMFPQGSRTASIQRTDLRTGSGLMNCPLRLYRILPSKSPLCPGVQM